MNEIDKLKQAIANCIEVEQKQCNSNNACAEEHRQLRLWLEELLLLKGVEQSFESAYQKAMKEIGCNYGGEFAQRMFKYGADNLIEQAVSNGQKKYEVGMEFMKWRAIKAFKDNCQHPKDTEPCECKLCVRWVGGHCELLDGFIEKLNS